MNKILLIGGGGHCKSVIDVIEAERKYDIAGIIDKDLEIGYRILEKYKVIGRDEDLEKLRKECKYAIITVGQIKTPRIRIKLYELLKNLNYELPVIISPLAYVSKYAEIGEGTIVMHNALVNAGAKVGKNCIINNKSLVEHDAVIGNHCHISTAAIINGEVIIGNEVFIGSNCVISNNITIVSNSVIGVGSVINMDIKEPGIYTINSLRKIR